MKSTILNDCPPLLKDFLFYMETIKGRSGKTVEAYYIDIRMFLRYIKAIRTNTNQLEDFDEIKIADITTETICNIKLADVYEFLNFTLEIRKNNPNTRSRKVSSIKSFYNYIASKTTLLKENPIKDLEVPSVRKTVPKYLSLEQSIELITHVDTKFSDRDYCIITLFLNCGMRVSELCGINLADISYSDKRLKLLGKGNKERIIYLNDISIDSITTYLPKRINEHSQPKGDNKNALFLSQNGTRLTSRRVEQIVKQCLILAGLGGMGFSPHKLRHTAATLMYQHGGVDIRILQEILGHESLGTTEIYTHISDTQMQKAADSSPLSKISRKINNKKDKEKDE